MFAQLTTECVHSVTEPLIVQIAAIQQSVVVFLSETCVVTLNLMVANYGKRKVGTNEEEAREERNRGSLYTENYLFPLFCVVDFVAFLHTFMLTILRALCLIGS